MKLGAQALWVCWSYVGLPSTPFEGASRDTEFRPTMGLPACLLLLARNGRAPQDPTQFMQTKLLKQLRDKAWTKYAKDCVFGLDWPRGLKPWLMTRSSQPQRRATLTKKQALSQKKELKKNTSYLLCGLMAFNAILSRRISAQLQ